MQDGCAMVRSAACLVVLNIGAGLAPQVLMLMQIWVAAS